MGLNTVKPGHRPIAAAAAWLAGCSLLLAADAGLAGPASEVRTALPGPVAIIAPLLDDEGRVMPADPAAVPADPSARTRAGLYATEAQAAQVESVMAESALSVRVTPEGVAAGTVERALLGLEQAVRAGSWPASATLFVRGTDLRHAARAADRLHDAGYTRVFLVTR
jgi:hypothetical protein